MNDLAAALAALSALAAPGAGAQVELVGALGFADGALSLTPPRGGEGCVSLIAASPALLERARRLSGSLVVVQGARTSRPVSGDAGPQTAAPAAAACSGSDAVRMTAIREVRAP